ncbi:MAG: AIR synthase family protein [candidate division KSB1 bacterium]|jgi:hydrogenase maturation factor|nr:AIR synthase family protein [candidate division KSB1 bacterium]
MKSKMPDIGKVSPDIFEEIILPHLGRKRSDILVGPQNGVDVGVVDLGNGQVMVTTTDPIFVVPPYGWERSAWFAIHILASDAVTSGLSPDYITMDLNMPLSVTRDDFEILWSVMHRECDKIGMAVISGHTGRYEGCDFPMIGGATVICVGPDDKYVTPTMAQTGDSIIITKGAAVEAAGLFAVTFPDKIAEAYGEKTAKEAEEIFWQMSVVEDALTAVQAGVRENGVTAMHDATECGVWGGLYEVAQASSVGMVIDKEKIIVQENVRKICDLFEIDPYTSISEGTLILTCKAHKADEVVSRLDDKGILSSIIGEIVDKEQGMHFTENGVKKKLIHPKVDPFWGAFGKAASEGR